MAMWLDAIVGCRAGLRVRPTVRSMLQPSRRSWRIGQHRLLRRSTWRTTGGSWSRSSRRWWRSTNGNGHSAKDNGHHDPVGIGPTVELVLGNCHAKSDGNGRHGEAPEPQQSLFSWAEFMAEEPVVKRRNGKPKPQSPSLFEWAFSSEQEVLSHGYSSTPAPFRRYIFFPPLTQEPGGRGRDAWTAWQQLQTDKAELPTLDRAPLAGLVRELDTRLS